MITLTDKPSLKKKQQQGPGLTSNLLDCCASMGKTQVQNEGTVALLALCKTLFYGRKDECFQEIPFTPTNLYVPTFKVRLSSKENDYLKV